MLHIKATTLFLQQAVVPALESMSCVWICAVSRQPYLKLFSSLTLGGSKTADEYINSMAKSASADELKNMRGQATEQMKMTVFYRYWVRIFLKKFVYSNVLVSERSIVEGNWSRNC